MEYYEFRAMNTDIVFAAEGPAEEIAQGFERAHRLVNAREHQFSRFLDDSEMTRLNNSTGTWFPASIGMYQLVRQAREFFEETGGLFDPSILDALEQAGYDRSMDEIRAHGAHPRKKTESRSRPDFSQIELDDAARAIRLPPGMRIDLGGIAKGWIAERAAELLANFSPVCAVNAGGDLFSIGWPIDEPGWRISLEDPRDPSDTLAVLRIGPGAVATSSITRRRWVQGEQARHHIIDPRTQAPAETDWLSVTVIAARATMAEVYAKTLLRAGSAGAERLAAGKQIAYVAVNNAGQLWGSPNASPLLEALPQQ